MNVSLEYVNTESFHMVSDSDPDIISWAGVGDSFTIKDIEAFQKVRTSSFVWWLPFSIEARRILITII